MIDSTFKYQSAASKKAAIELVYPKLITEKFISGSIESTEFLDNKFTKSLDMKSGIDAFILNNDKIQTLSNRIQWGKSWNTFTIRYAKVSGAKTEYAKFKSAIENNDRLYPTYMVHSYIQDNKLISMAIAKTIDIMKRVDLKCIRLNYADKTLFLYVDWAKLPSNKIQIWRSK